MASVSTTMVTTALELPGQKVVRNLGVVRGIVVRSPGVARGILGGLRSLFQGNIGVYEDVCETARAQAHDRMVAQAEQLGAHAVITMRYDATEFMSGITEVLAYGTAVTLAPAPAS